MTEAQLLAGIRDGSLDRESAIRELIAKIVARTGKPAEQVSLDLDNLLRAFDEEVQQSSESVPTPQVLPAALPDPNDIQFDLAQLPEGERRGQAFSPFGDTSGQRAAFRAFRQEAFPEGLSNRGQTALTAQFNAVSPFFNPQRALGNIPADQDFREFIRANIGQRGFDPVSSARQIGGLFGRDLNEDSPEFQLRRQLIQNPDQQVGLAFAAANQGFPAPFSGGLLETLRDREARLRTSQPIDPTTGLPVAGATQFLPDFLRRNAFGGR